MTDLSEYVSDYVRTIDGLPKDRHLLAQAIAEAYLDQHYDELGLSEDTVELASHKTTEQVMYYLG